MRKLLRLLARIITAPFRFIIHTTRKVRGFFTQDVEDSPLPDVLAKTVENPVGLFEHIDALRKHLLRSLVAIAIMTALSLTFNQMIMEFLASPLEGGLDSLVAIDVTEPIGTVMRVALLSGFALAFPYVALELWFFIAPGLNRKSRAAGLIAIPIATFFFIGGMAFAYYIMLPAALPFLLNFMGIATIPRPASYFGFVTSILFWIGLSFEFPLAIFVLASIGLVNAKVLAQQWRLAVVIIALISALITPTVDPVNMALVMGPMVLLYSISILLAKIAQGKRLRRQSTSAKS